MKLILTIFILVLTISNGRTQDFGISGSFSTVNVLGIDLFYGKENNRFHIGAGIQPNGQKMTVVSERKWNYGLTKIGNSDYLWMIDLGYSRIIAKMFTIHPELSFGSKVYFTNYRDRRFKDDGYSLITDSESKAGIGVNIGYILDKKIEPFIGYHTLKKMNLGIRYNFHQFDRK